MSEPSIDPHTRTDIERLVKRILQDSGFREPPVDIYGVLETLNLDREFYDLEDPGLTHTLRHQIIIGAQRLSEIVEKVRLQALLFFDEKRVVLDKDLPQIKHDWAYAHEAGHEIIPWHREFCRGDTVLTLDPTWHELLEAEANYAASELLFCGEAFTIDSWNSRPCLASIHELQQRYRKSLLATARRYIRKGPDRAMILLVSTAWWDPQLSDQPGRVRHLVISLVFELQFGGLGPEQLRKDVDSYTSRRRGGPVGEFVYRLQDANGEMRLFFAECFYNGYYVMTLLVEQSRTNSSTIAVAERAAIG